MIFVKMPVYASFWRWYAKFEREDERFSPDEKGLAILKQAYNDAVDSGIKEKDIDYYMRNVMMKFDNPKAKL